MKRLLFIFVFLLSVKGLIAQIPVGAFRDHLSFNNCTSVTCSDDYVYASGENGIMYISKNAVYAGIFECNKWSKINGITDVEISKIAYDKSSATMVVAYANGNLDFIKGDVLTNIPDVKNKQINGSKNVQQIFFSGNNCYLVYHFGVVVLNMTTYLVQDTWYNNAVQNVLSYAIEIYNDRIYMATNKGIYSIDRQSQSIADFGVWQREEELGELGFNMLLPFKGKLYANRNSFMTDENDEALSTDSVYVLDEGHWHYEPLLETVSTRALFCSDNELFLLNWSYIEIFDGVTTGIRYFWEKDKIPNLSNAIADGANLWVSDNRNGLWFWNRALNTVELLNANGPYSNKCFNMSCEGGVLASVAGGFNIWAPAYLYPVCNTFIGERWSSLNDEFHEFGYSHDLINVAVNPNNPSEYYVASWGNGVYKCADGKIVTQYDESNSTLRKSSDGGTILVSGLCFDEYGNLWVTNTNSPTIINVLKADGSWVAMNKLSASIGAVAQHIYSDSRGIKWITFPRSSTQSLYAFYDNNTIDNQSDDKLRLVDMNADAEVETAVVRCITEDKDGRMWIGTEKGVKVIYNPEQVLNGQAYPRNVIMEQGGYVSVLLEFEDVTCIAVDGANRKWMGTSKAGVFLMNDNGTEELLHFTTENSVLLSDVIFDIAIDGNTGEVFFATDKGICSYRGTATEGKEDYSEVKVFPNPVHSGYTGVISVIGLMENSFCKIVDAAGNLIWQGYANGGELVWDGKDFKGRRPATGVYFVFSSSKSGKEKNVAKLLFVN